MRKIIDLRSDTSTLPTKEMLEAMNSARLGNDGYGEDPTVNELQELAARKVGKESALFVPSGTQGNLVALLSHLAKGMGFVAEANAHIITVEKGYDFVGGFIVHRVPGHLGAMPPQKVEEAILASSTTKTGLVCLENTHNNAGGTVIPLDNKKSICEIAKNYGLPVHMDGARIFNASIVLGIPVKELLKDVDSIMFCLSKGLCAPIGSIVAGSTEFIVKAREMRTIVGGGMRQVGAIAAAGIVAIEKMVDRLVEDHKNAKYLAERLNEIDGIYVDMETVQSNMVFFNIEGLGIKADVFAQKLREYNIKVSPRRQMGEFMIRAVAHKDISREDINYSIDVIKEVASSLQ